MLQQFNIAAMELRDFYSQLQHDGHPFYLKSSSEQYLLYPSHEGLQTLRAKVYNKFVEQTYNIYLHRSKLLRII